MSTTTTPTTPADLADEASAWAVGGGILTMALFPLALPTPDRGRRDPAPACRSRRWPGRCCCRCADPAAAAPAATGPGFPPLAQRPSRGRGGTASCNERPLDHPGSRRADTQGRRLEP